MGSFFHAVHVFGEHLAAVRWQFLAFALLLSFVRLLFRAIAWRVILLAAYPGERIRFRSVLGAYLVGVGVNSVAPARGGDVVKLYLVKHRIPNASYATLAPTLVAETLLDAVIAGALIGWALAIGALPTHQVYSRIPSVDWGFFVKHAEATSIGLALVVAAAIVALIVYLEHGGASQGRIARGFAIMRDPGRLFRGVIVPQLISWVFRVAAIFYFLKAFGVEANIHNALLALVVDSLSTLFPATPGGAGTKQGLIVYLFHGRAINDSLLLAFSVGVNIAVVVFSLLLGTVSLLFMARTVSWKRLRAAQAEEKGT